MYDSYYNNYTQENILSDNRAICHCCNKVVEITLTKKDVVISHKLSIDNLDVYVCTKCDKIAGVPEFSIEKISVETIKFKEARPSISELIKDGGETKYRWCESFACGCVGAANCSGRLSENLYTKNEWILWKEENPEVKQPCYIVQFKLPDKKRMAIIKVIRQFLYIGTGCASNIVDQDSPAFSIDYAEQTDAFVSLDLSILQRYFASIDVDYKLVERKEHYDYSIPTYPRVEN